MTTLRLLVHQINVAAFSEALKCNVCHHSSGRLPAHYRAEPSEQFAHSVPCRESTDKHVGLDVYLIYGRRWANLDPQRVVTRGGSDYTKVFP